MKNLKMSVLKMSVVSLLTICACATMTPVQSYQPSTVQAGLFEGALHGKKVAVDPFTGVSDALKPDVSCRAGSFHLEGGGADYVRRALVDDLGPSYAPSAPARVTGKLTRFALSSTDGKWDLEMEVGVVGGSSVTERAHQEFEAGFVGTTACDHAAAAFPKAVHALLEATAQDPRFVALFK